MTVEIRELIIRTEICTQLGDREKLLVEENLKLLKKQLMEECRRQIQKQGEKNGLNR